MPVSSRLARNVPSISPTVGKFCTPAKPASRTSAQEDVHQPERVGAADAGQHRRVAHDRQHLAGHLHDDRVGVAVGHQPGERAAAGHPVAAGVVDDDQVGAAGLGALGRQARAGAGADDHAAGRRCVARSFARASSPVIALAFMYSSSLSTIASANAGSLMSLVELDQLDAAAESVAQRLEQRRVGLGVVERLAARRRSSRRRLSGRNSAVGPVAADSLRAIRRPSSALSSGVVRISVTGGLCT